MEPGRVTTETMSPVINGTPVAAVAGPPRAEARAADDEAADGTVAWADVPTPIVAAVTAATNAATRRGCLKSIGLKVFLPSEARRLAVPGRRAARQQRSAKERRGDTNLCD